jgi:serine/threonine-protein kinase
VRWPEGLPGVRDAGETTTASYPPDSGPSEPGVVERQLLPGTQFGKRYRIVELLGRGAMGEVYRADDLQLGQAVALKFLPPHLAGDPAALARLRNEVRVARQISHANVCRVYDIGEADDQYFLSMEYIDGEDLASVLRRLGRPTREKSLEIARQLCVGLAAAHEAGVLHRDLKPANIMIDGRGRVRITDFGLAGFAHELAREGRAGTPGFMAPELYSGGLPSARTDIYALGIVLYELFTGRRAFDSDTPSGETRPRQISIGRPPSEFVDDIDPVVEEIILRCIDRDPSRRPTSALAVAAVLPGVDLVAAALAAGQTPSPEMVAAAGGKGALRPVVAVAWLVAVIAGLALIAGLNEHVSLHGLAPPAKPALVLADQARKILERLGYPAPAYSAYGWEHYDGYLDHIQETDTSPDRWSGLADRRPSVYWLWYRESPVPLIPRNDFSVIGYRDPPHVAPGMAALKLDDRGRLAVLRIVPPQVADESPLEGPFDYTWLFEAAGLDPADFGEVEPQWIPRDYADARNAWEGHYPEQPEVSVRVEAASFAGRPVYFNVLETFDEPFSATPEERAAHQTMALWVGLLFFGLAIVVPPVVARRNWRRGNGDRAGALRLGIAIWALALLAWTLAADHTSNADAEVQMFLRALGLCLLIGVWSALVYLALEPYLRRLWPETMISWTRLLMGRFGDPRVGRDVLLGAFAGVLIIMIQRVEWLVPTWVGAAPRQPWVSLDAMLLGGRRMFAQLFAPSWFDDPLVILLVLTILRFLLRRHWLAVAGTFALLMLASGPRILDDAAGIVLWAALVQVALVWTIVLATLIRIGLLAMVTTFFFLELLQRWPLTLDTSLWFSGTSLTAMLVMVAIAAVAMRISLGRAPASMLPSNGA